tara:strand:+ start:1501 stop:1725 length:225 start_codon:yes stop_codon:yes gene_type:complete
MNFINLITTALKAKYQGEIEAAKANIEIYMYKSVGIGEHGDIMSAIDEQVSIMASAKEKLDALKEFQYLEKREK